MIEIKIRAWDKIEKIMLYRTIWDLNWYLTPENDSLGCHCVRGITPDDKQRLELMQFTGLKDKNGKEIYKGDIVKYKYKVSTKDCFSEYDIKEEEKINIVSIGLDGVYPRYLDYFEDNSYDNDGSKNHIVLCNIEIIGNEFENLELLKIISNFRKRR